jgi:ribosomal protein S18 acetylase RimI-like enzyme
MGKIDFSKLIIRLIRKNDTKIISDFSTYEKDLKDFLVENSIRDQEQFISKTYLLFYNNNLVGYITLLNDSLRVKGPLRTIFLEKNILYKTLPALKIGRLAIDNNYLRQGFGRILLEIAYNSANKICTDISGCRFLTLDAKRNKDSKKDSIHFYKQFNFNVLKNRLKGTTPMYLDIKLNKKYFTS